MQEGRTFDIRTDHKPLVHAFSQKPEKASPRPLRQLDFISQFTTSIVHVAGIENTTADALSRFQPSNAKLLTTTNSASHKQVAKNLNGY